MFRRRRSGVRSGNDSVSQPGEQNGVQETDPQDDAGARSTREPAELSAMQLAQLVNALTLVADALRSADAPRTRRAVRGVRSKIGVGTLKTVAQALIIALGMALLAVMVREALRDVWQIEAITVPPEWEQRGFSSRVFVNLMLDEIERIRIDGQAEESDVRLARESSIPDLEIPGSGLSTQAVLRYLRSLLGRQSTSVTGEVVLEERDAVMTIRVKGRREKARPAETLRHVKSEPMELIRLGAAFVVRQTDPCLLASAYASRNQITESLDTVQHCLLEDSAERQSWGHNLLGLILLDERNDRSGAVENFKKAIELDPKNAGPVVNLGWLQLREKNYTAAAPYFEKALELDPRAWPAYLNLSYILAEQGRHDDAIEKLKKAIEIDGRNPVLYLAWGNILHHRKDYAGAATLYEKVLALDPKNAEAINNWGDALEQQKDYQGAAEKYRKALEIDPTLAVAFSGLGSVLRQLGDRPGAEAAYQKVIDIDPDGEFAQIARDNLNEMRTSRPSRTGK